MTKRTTAVGACLFSALIISAIIAASASAGEYGECFKKSKGKYKDAGCEKLAGAREKGKFEWRAVGSKDKPFTDTDGKATLRVGEATVECTKSKSTGEILGWQKNVEHITFEGCKLITAAGKPESCKSPGKKAGVIATFKLDTYLIDHGTPGPSSNPERVTEPKENEVWNEYESSEHEPYLAEFECSGILFRVKGTISGVFMPVSKMTKKATVAFTEAGEQDLETEYSTTKGQEWIGPIASLLFTTETIKFKSKVEVRPCNEPNAKEEGLRVLPCEHEELPLPWEPPVGT